MKPDTAFALAQEMIDAHGLKGWRAVRRNYKSTGAITYFDTKTIGFSAALIEKWTKAQFTQIVLHEIAHALVGHSHGHDRVWAARARSIGYRGGRTHDLPTVEARWILTCPDHGELGRRHNRSRKVLCCRMCAKIVKWTDSSKLTAAV